MTTALAEYEKLQHGFSGIEGVSAGQMFGKACLKIGGKAFVAQHKDTVVFKLSGTDHAKAIGNVGAVLWDPSGKGRPMKEWVALTIEYRAQFKTLTTAAMVYVRSIG